VKDQDDQLLGEIARRNWVVLTGLVLLSLLWRSVPVTLGVLSGGLVAIGGYLWLHHSLKKVIAAPSRHSARSFKFSYFVRLGSLAAVLLLLIAVARVNPLGLAAGLSVVVINILWTTLKRLYPTRRQ
jgi:hypothetical protein